MKYATALLQGMTCSFIFQLAVSGVDCIEIVNRVGPKGALKKKKKKSRPMNFFLALYLKKMLGQR